jgi:hypothetical protein
MNFPFEQINTFYEISVRETFTMEAAGNFYDKHTGEDVIHIVKESPISFHISYVVPKTSPFISVLNKALINAREIGFFVRADRNIESYLKLKRINRFKNIRMFHERHQKISIFHLNEVFKFFLGCVLVCFVAFLAEIVVHKVADKKRRNDDLKIQNFIN